MGRGGWDDSPVEELPPPPPPQHSIDINCVQDFPTLGNQTVEVPRAQSGRSFTLRASRGNVASMEEEFPALGNPLAQAPTRGGSAQNNATTSVHFKVNAKKGGVNDSSSRGGGQRRAVSIQYSRSSGAAEQKPSKGASKNASQSAANVVSSKAGNITLKSLQRSKRCSYSNHEKCSSVFKYFIN
ncbi:hypothetical protein FHG87_012315 [Trinorchestia longiramus]|nr:hypothetical protein FHG87_012315 [Trinorchestia longiramus]